MAEDHVPILLLRLEGPLQSWGVRSRWSRRDTGQEPSKSAIIGLLGCAAGIPRPDWRSVGEPVKTMEEWDRALCFGIRIDRAGIIETDYHTVQGHFWQSDGKVKTKISLGGVGINKAKLEPPHTEVTWRDYLNDAAFLVALTVKQTYQADSKGLLNDLENYLKNPRWPLYLGRKSCVPTRPVLERLTDEYQDLKDALNKEPWAAPRSHLERKTLQKADRAPTITAWIECQDGEYERQDAHRLNQLRFYDYRRCKKIDVETEHLPWRIT